MDLVEITMRTPRAMEAIKILNKELPQLLIGAGTIFSTSRERLRFLRARQNSFFCYKLLYERAVPFWPEIKWAGYLTSVEGCS